MYWSNESYFTAQLPHSNLTLHRTQELICAGCCIERE